MPQYFTLMSENSLKKQRHRRIIISNQLPDFKREKHLYGTEVIWNDSSSQGCRILSNIPTVPHSYTCDLLFSYSLHIIKCAPNNEKLLNILNRIRMNKNLNSFFVLYV